MIVLDDTICASARLRACSSRRSMLNSSSRMGSWLSQGDDRLTLSKARRGRAFNLTFPPRDESAISPHERISQKCLRSERAPCDATGEPGKMLFRPRQTCRTVAVKAGSRDEEREKRRRWRARTDSSRRRLAARRFGASPSIPPSRPYQTINNPCRPCRPPGIAGASFFGVSATIASVVIIRPATEAAS